MFFVFSSLVWNFFAHQKRNQNSYYYSFYFIFFSILLLYKNSLADDSYVFGNNNHGQLGIDSNETQVLEPLSVVYLNFSFALSSGANHTLIFNFFQVMSFGDNSNGQLGLGDNEDRIAPTLIPNITEVLDISTGAKHSMIIFFNGSVVSFGSNFYGQLGLGDNEDRLEPTLIPNISNAGDISLGSYHSFILLQNGSVMSCGYNYNGELGLGFQNNLNISNLSSDAGINEFNLIPNLENVTGIVVGGYHSFFLLTNGSILSCGYNAFGQLGFTSFNIGVSSPTLLPISVDIFAVSLGSLTSYLLLMNGSVLSFGNNDFGQLGLGDNNPRQGINLIPNLYNTIQISAGSSHFVVKLENNVIMTCGYNAFGQLGIGNTTNQPSLTPISVSLDRLNLFQSQFSQSDSTFLLNSPTITEHWPIIPLGIYLAFLSVPIVLCIYICIFTMFTIIFAKKLKKRLYPMPSLGAGGGLTSDDF